MVSDDRDRLLRAYASFNHGQLPDWSFFDPAIEHDQTQGLFLDGVFYGHDGLRAALEEIDADWVDLRLDPEQVIDVDGRLLVLVRMRARVRDSHAELDAQIAHLWEFRDGRAIRWAVYEDRASATRALRASSLDNAAHAA